MNMKNLLTILLMLPFLAQGQTGEKNFIDQNYVEVTGKAEMAVSPNLIYLKILLNEKDNKNKTPLAERENAMVSKLKDLGIDVTKDLMVEDMASNFRTYLLAKSEILLGKEFQLVVRDGKTVGRVFIAMEEIGVSNVSIDRLDHNEMLKYKREVEQNAMKAAKEKADLLASAVGQNIGRAIYIQEGEWPLPGTPNRVLYRGVSSMSNASLKDSPEIDLEKIKIEYSVICRFELK